jgi:hypothetical protein
VVYNGDIVKFTIQTQTTANFAEKLIITLDFEKIANFFPPKIGKNRKNSDHNIDPWPSFSFDQYKKRFEAK